MQSLPTVFYNDAAVHEPFKVNLFTRISQMEQLTQELIKVGALSKKQKLAWIRENETRLQTYVDACAQHVHLEVRVSEFDQELSQLFLEYSMQLQSLLKVVEGIFAVKKPE